MDKDLCRASIFSGRQYNHILPKHETCKRQRCRFGSDLLGRLVTPGEVMSIAMGILRHEHNMETHMIRDQQAIVNNRLGVIEFGVVMFSLYP